jgi:hypothetical protein
LIIKVGIQKTLLDNVGDLLKWDGLKSTKMASYMLEDEGNGLGHCLFAPLAHQSME